MTPDFQMGFLIIAAAVALSVPLGKWMRLVLCPVAEGRFDRALKDGLGRSFCGEQDWKGYLLSMLGFNLVLFVLCVLVLAFQHVLPFNSDPVGRMSPDLVFNTAVSFVTNTGMGHYADGAVGSGAPTLVLIVLQFASAATGIAVFTAFCRLISGERSPGNFFVDFGRTLFGVLLPLSLVVSLLLAIGGLPMCFDGAEQARTLEGGVQLIRRGPVAAFVAIKQLGTNGGGFFAANSAHPFENAGLLTNFIECVSLPLLPMACIWMFGLVTGRCRDAAVIFVVLLVFLVAKAALCCAWEGTDNLAGRELRLGAAPVWTTLTTCASNGSLNATLDGMKPLAVLVPLAGMWFNVTFGGVGSGFLALFAYVIVAVFISGLMVGRTPECFGRKVETSEMKLAILVLLLHPLLILGGTALFCVMPDWVRAVTPGPGFRGFTEALYEMTSAAANNGSGFKGLLSDTVPWNLATGFLMLVGRYVPLALMLALAGGLAAKKPVPVTVGTLRTDTLLFGCVLALAVIFIGALLFLPVAVLGPFADYLSTLEVR